MQPLVSICTPIYNVSEFIERCSRSLFEQTYQNVEYIFVDDCSPDDSMLILRRVLEDYSHVAGKVKFIKHTYNRGLAAARNSAIAAAKGEFIVHVDSDDWIEPTMVEDMMNTHMRTGGDIVSCNAIAHHADRDELLIEPNYTSKDEMLNQILQPTLDHVLWRRLIRRSLYTDNNIKAVEGIDIGEDHYTFPRLVYYAQKFAKCDKLLYHYNCTNVNSYIQSSYCTFNIKRYLNNRDSVSILVDFFQERDSRFVDQLMMIKAYNIYYNFFAVLQLRQRDLYKQLCKDWNDIDDVYKGLPIFRIRLLTSSFYLNVLRVYMRILVKKVIRKKKFDL